MTHGDPDWHLTPRSSGNPGLQVRMRPSSKPHFFFCSVGIHHHYTITTIPCNQNWLPGPGGFTVMSGSIKLVTSEPQSTRSTAIRLPCMDACNDMMCDTVAGDSTSHWMTLNAFLLRNRMYLNMYLNMFGVPVRNSTVFDV